MDREKISKYSNIGNDKSLIETRIPTESDLESFEIWKKRVSKKSLQFCIIFTLVFIFVCCISFMSSSEKSNIATEIMFILFFGLADFVLIKSYLNLRSWKMEYASYGKVIDKYKKTENGKIRHYVVVSVNNNQLQFKSKSEYFLLNIDDEVIVFSVEGFDNTYVTKK